MTFNRILCSALFTVLILFPACKNNRNIESTAEIRFGFTTEPATLDPLNPASTADGRSILFNVFEGLVKPNTDGTLMPCIAESWTIEQEGLIYNFTLRDNIFFHDGSQLAPSDVKFSLDTAAAAGFSGLDNIQEVRIQKENEISVILKLKDPDFLPFLTIGMVKALNTDREKNVIGTGPFSVESYTPQRNLVLLKFDNYWQDNLPHLDKVTIAFFANFDSLMVALRGGSIDGAFITGAMAAQLDSGQFDLFHNTSAAVQLMALNNGAAPFNDMRVRLAINYGIDVQGIIDAAFFGLGVPSGSPIIPGLSVYYEDQSYYYNPELARALLAQAGYNNENKLSLEITVPSNYTMHVDTAQVIVSQLEKIGVNAEIRLVDWSTWRADVYLARNYQATVISLDSPTVSARSFLARYNSNSSSNFINFKNAEYDRVYGAVLTETDSAQRISLYKQAQRIIAENAASVYIQDIYYYIVFRSGTFTGVKNYPLYVFDFAEIYRKANN